MRLPSVPGPRDLIALVERGGEALDRLLDAAPRIGRLLDDTERLLKDVDGLVSRIEGTRQEADALVTRAAKTQQDADALVARVEEPVRRINALLAALEPSLTALQPTLERLAETTDPREVDALVGLVDHLPMLVDRVERDILPILATLTSVAPDLHDLLDVSRELNGMLAKIPGMGRIKQRVDEQQAEAGHAHGQP
jgi:ABC-type transporter Mla subunit MlaD